MGKKVAVLLDGSFVVKTLYRRLNTHPTAEQVRDFAKACISPDEEIFRIYYYDCPPYSNQEVNPISRLAVDFSQTPQHNRQVSFQDKLARMDNVAFRRGVLAFRGWKIKKKSLSEIMANKRAVEDRDLVPDLEQKRVDIKIGLDIAWLSSKNIVERIILVTGDADFIPAMKFARREGIQIVLVTLGNPTKPEMREHTDEFRAVNWQP